MPLILFFFFFFLFLNPFNCTEFQWEFDIETRDSCSDMSVIASSRCSYEFDLCELENLKTSSAKTITPRPLKVIKFNDGNYENYIQSIKKDHPMPVIAANILKPKSDKLDQQPLHKRIRPQTPVNKELIELPSDPGNSNSEAYTIMKNF